MAQELGMSVSEFHALSPFQFQKQLRLQKARRLMLSEDLDATSAAYRVSYQDAAHFHREYKSHIVHPTHERRVFLAALDRPFLTLSMSGCLNQKRLE